METGSRYPFILRPSGQPLNAHAEETVLQALQRQGVPILAACNGDGRCGQCRVRWLTPAPDPTGDDRVILLSSELSDGWRLACRHRLQGRAELWVPPIAEGPHEGKAITATLHPVDIPRVSSVELTFSSAKPSLLDLLGEVDALAGERWIWSETMKGTLSTFLPSLREGEAWSVHAIQNRVVHLSPSEVPPYGVAVDIGTTTLAAYLVDLRSGQIVVSQGGTNSQFAHGADIMTRIAYARNESGTSRLTTLVRRDIHALIQTLLLSVRASWEPLIAVWIVGNPSMLHMVLGVDPSPLGIAPFRPRFIGGLSVPAHQVGLPVSKPVLLSTVPGIAGFVGSDAVAAAVSSELLHSRETTLLIDVGTNAEILLQHEGHLVACSAAAGPALEGVGLSCSMPAREGTIHAVSTDSRLRVETIGNVPPVGFCGSGLMDVVAFLLRHKLILPSGRIQSNPELEGLLGLEVTPEAIVFAVLGEGLRVTQKDLRQIQLATAAMRTGILCLLKIADVPLEDVSRVVITGSFGFALQHDSLMTLGLLNPAWRDRVEMRENAAGEGAVLCLLDEARALEAQEISWKTRHVSLETLPEFAKTFIDCLGWPETS